MKRLTQIVIFILSIVFINNACASEYVGKVENILVRDADGLVYITFSGTRSGNIPDCAKNTSL